MRVQVAGGIAYVSVDGVDGGGRVFVGEGS